MLLDGLLKFRVADGKKRPLLQLPGENAEPQTAKSERRGNIPHARNGAGGEFRARHPKQIDEAHEDQPDGHSGEKLRVALQVPREQEEEGHKKMENQDDYGDDAPASVQARAVEADFFRLVAGPDDEQLREIEVGPEHHEGEEEL